MLKWLEITELKDSDEEIEVYNLEVENNPNYFANGILVHNCFCREMEQELFNKYFDGWSRDLVRNAQPEDFQRLFDRAFGTDKDSDDWIIKCFRYGLPFNMGSKAETFCYEDLSKGITDKVLKLFLDYKVPLIIETKSHYGGLKRYLDIIKEMKNKVAIIVSILGGSDTFNYDLEPNAPPPSMRWKFVEDLNRLGIWCGVRWEPILPKLNATDDIFEKYAFMANKSLTKHVSFFNYRTSNYKIAQKNLEGIGINYVKLLENNLDEVWVPYGKRLAKQLRKVGIKCSSPDFINFPFDNDYISCCGIDELFTSYLFNFQYACRIILERGNVSWDDMENIEFKEPKAYERMKLIWNGDKHKQYFSLIDSPEIIILDKKDGMNVYGRSDIPINKRMGLFV